MVKYMFHKNAVESLIRKSNPAVLQNMSLMKNRLRLLEKYSYFHAL